MADNIARITAPIIPREPNGYFAKGNPGRPKGAKGKASKAILEQVKSMGGDAIQALWESVQARERWAVEYVLGKILPANRLIEFEDLTPDDIKAAIIDGDISPDEARTLSTTIARIDDIATINILRERLDELEKMIADGKAQ